MASRPSVAVGRRGLLRCRLGLPRAAWGGGCRRL